MSSKIQTKAEQNTKIIRQISQLPHNKNCFDCGQKGPTYVDDTIGAFVCTGCSGILRGLNPPHRIKSISMGTFSDDEVKFIQLRGNAFCRKVWLWGYDPQIGPRPPEVRDDQKMKDFLSLKYEKKKWFHSAHDTLIADQLKQTDVQSVHSVQSVQSVQRGTESESSLSRRTSNISNNSNNNFSNNNLNNSNNNNSQRSFRSEASPTATMKSNGSSGNISLPRSHTSSSINQAPPDRSSSAASDDLFGMFGGLTVSSHTTNPAHHTSTTPVVSQEWASFSRSQTTPLFPPTPSTLAPHAPLQRAPQTQASQVPLQPTPQQKVPVSPAKPIASSQSDKYAALAELDEILNSASPSTQKQSLPDPQTFLATSPTGYGRGGGGNASLPPWGVSPQNGPLAPWGASPQNGLSAPWGASPQNGFWTDSITHPAQLGVDPSNVWGQMPAYHPGVGGAGGVANPFLGAGHVAPSGGGAQAPAVRHPPGTYNTNPFL